MKKDPSDEERVTENHIYEIYRVVFPLEELVENGKLVSGEASPSYLLMGAPVAERIKRFCPHTRLIVAVRDPVKRAYSQYNMTRDPVGTPAQLEKRGRAELGSRSYEEVVTEELDQLEAAGITPDTDPQRFQAFLSQVPWTNAAGNYHGGHSWVLRGLYCLQLAVYLQYFPPEAFCIVRLDQLAAAPNDTMLRVHRHLALPEEPLPAELLVPKNARSYSQPLDTPEQQLLHQRLTAFFQPFNAKFDAMCQLYGW